MVVSNMTTAKATSSVVSLTITNPVATKTLLEMLIAKKERALPEFVAILQRPIAARHTPVNANGCVHQIHALKIFIERRQPQGIGDQRPPCHFQRFNDAAPLLRIDDLDADQDGATGRRHFSRAPRRHR